MAEVVAVCISRSKGTPKVEVPEIEVKIDHGIVGDAHAGNWHRQISLLGDESVDVMREKLPELPHGAFAENILTRGICLYKLPVGTKLRVGPALLEVTQIGKECHKGCAIRQITGDCVMPREGIFTKVLEEGIIRPGDEVTIQA
jgi:MOSC domain-containing protein YiiM